MSGGILELDFTIQGMSCAACAARIEKTIGKMEGVSEVAVSFPLRTAWVQIYEGAVTQAQLADKVGQLGFSAMTNETAKEGLLREKRHLRLRLLASILLTLPLLAGMTEHLAWFAPLADTLPSWLFQPFIQLAFATVIQFVLGMPFYFGAYYAIRQKSANMDVLVAIGTTSAYLYSHYVVFRDGAVLATQSYDHGSPLYFETSAVVITAILLGKYIETSASLKAQNESYGFEQLRVQSATVERGGQLSQIRTEFVRQGDIVHVESHELIPVDGTILSGESMIDEALVTGESVPVSKLPGDTVWAGTRNVYSKLKIVTHAAGHDTMLSRIQELVIQGQKSKSSIQRQVDAVAGWFVPAMLMAAAATFLGWGLWADPGNWSKAAVCAIAVLLAACPCALGLAAPISLVIASGKLAKRGIVAKEASAVEKLAAVKTIVLDKTGTLTEGKPKVNFMAAFGISRSYLLGTVAALEKESDHPLAHALQAEAGKFGLVLPASERLAYTPSGGAEGCVRGEHAAVGNKLYVERMGCHLSKEVLNAAAEREKYGETVLYAVIRGNCVGLIGFGDAVKPEAKAMAAEMRRLKVTPVIATGDHSAPAFAVARALGIKTADVHSSMMPESKLTLVHELKRGGGTVAMAGDGWNDAPALAASDIGIAMGNGTYGALNAGHVTLLFSRLSAIPEAIKLSRLTIRNIRQNLAFAFFYNMAIIPFAAIGLLKPWMAGTAMALSSVSVVTNALRLKTRLDHSGEKAQP
ncbi:heavy metal translocating P-type ATPase [Paenibacillus sp. GCM10027627]|uniref:heavy metal translocating P-type ATPase n=1 Tax=unclassified Paenibacillus TaxID=185978 RepID=UPI003641A839